MYVCIICGLHWILFDDFEIEFPMKICVGVVVSHSRSCFSIGIFNVDFSLSCGMAERDSGLQQLCAWIGRWFLDENMLEN